MIEVDQVLYHKAPVVGVWRGEMASGVAMEILANPPEIVLNTGHRLRDGDAVYDSDMRCLGRLGHDNGPRPRPGVSVRTYGQKDNPKPAREFVDSG